jgi:hypothetical protein
MSLSKAGMSSGRASRGTQWLDSHVSVRVPIWFDLMKRFQRTLALGMGVRGIDGMGVGRGVGVGAMGCVGRGGSVSPGGVVGRSGGVTMMSTSS